LAEVENIKVGEKMSRMLVTGGAGFIGSNLVDYLIENEYDDIVVLDNLSTGKIDNLPKDIKFIRGDIGEKKLLTRILKDIDYIFHLAAFTSVHESITNPKKCYDVNVMGFLNILEVARLKDIKKIIFSSSSAVYDDSLSTKISEDAKIDLASPYAITKFDGEQLLKMYFEIYGLKHVILRYFNVFGPKQNKDSPYAAVIPKFIVQALRSKKLTIYGDGSQTRDFIYVKDVAKANLLAMKYSGKNKVFNVGSGRSISIANLAKLICKLTDINPGIINLPSQPGDPYQSLADIKRLKTELQWNQDYSFEKGLKKTIDWYKRIARK
jgi:UDP-glucose 4-epimerase